MKRDKEISISDFFKEDIFAADAGLSSAEEPAGALSVEDHTPVLEVRAAADDIEIRQYRKALRHFFISGEQTEHCMRVNTAPVLLAPYLRGETPDTDFPVFFNFEDQHALALRSVLQAEFERSFQPGEARILGQNLPRIERFVRQAMKDSPAVQPYGGLIRGAIAALLQLDVHGEEGKLFREQCSAFQAALLCKEGKLMPFSAYTVFQLLDLQLRARHAHIHGFVEELKKHKSGLEDLLLLHRDEDQGAKDAAAHLQDSFGFAGSMIAFDKIEGMMPPNASSKIPESRLHRLRDSLQIIDEALKYFSSTKARVFASSACISRFGLQGILSEATLVGCEQKPCAAAKAVYDNEVYFWVQVVAAVRVAELEIHNQYEEDLHTPYFKDFGLRYLSAADIQRFPPLVVVEENRRLMHEPEEFLALLSGNVPVKVLSVNLLRELDYPVNGMPSLHQEPAALALSHRNAYIYQGAADTPAWLNGALAEGLLAPSPALWNVLVPEPDGTDYQESYLRVRAAIESRYFPRLTYNIRAGAAFGSRFDISGNPHPELHFPSYALDIQTRSGLETAKYELTPADFFALDSALATQLEIVPVDFRNEDLISLAAYCYQVPEKLIGKIPFIWVVDEQNYLHQAAIPYTWLARCEERLEYWQFIQELGGVNSYHVKKAIERAKAEWDAHKAEELAAIRAEKDAEIERIRREEAGKAMERLVNVLLDLDNPVYAQAASPAAAAIPAPEPKVKATQEAAAVQPPKEEEAQVVSSEVWVESFRCTSCNECIDTLPAVFKYNSDKQAYVHNPNGGTYAKLVTVAEKCPAKCIHPGLPQNQDEPGIAELVKRAEALN